jgi:hypothetical protein
MVAGYSEQPDESNSEKVEVKVVSRSRKQPSLWLPKSEVELIKKLQAWLGEECVVTFLARLARVQKTGEGIYSVPSASTRDKTYLVNLRRRACPCEGFYNRKRCAHYKLASVKQLLEREQ